MSKKLKFEHCIEKVKTPQKLQKNMYLTEGKYPVISQEDELINGYCDKDDFVFKVGSPVIIFGDHTRKVKFIDFDFVLGADGAKILKPTPNLHPKYLYYYLTFSMPKSIGYARHYRLLKEILINVPPLEKQKAIVTKLDAVFAEIDKSIAAAERKREELDKLYASAVTKQYFSDVSTAVVKLREIAEIKGGKRLPKGKKLIQTVTDFPYIRVNDFTNEGTIDETSVQYITEDIQKEISRYTISAEDVYVSIAGTIGKTGVIPASLNNANLTENAAKIVLDKRCLRDYFYYFTTSTSFKEQALKQTRTAAQPKLALERLAKVELPLHEISQQKMIIDSVKAIQEYKIALLDINTKQIGNYQALKSAILVKELQREAS